MGTIQNNGPLAPVIIQDSAGSGYAAQAAASASAAQAAANAAQASANFRATFAEAIAAFAVDTYFASNATGVLRMYKRTATSPFYVDQGDVAAPISKALIAATGGAGLVGTADGASVQAKLNVVVAQTLLAGVAALLPYDGRVVAVTDAGKEGMFKCYPGAAPATDLWQGLYVTSTTAGWYWGRIWDGINASPDWFGAVRNNAAAAATNDIRIAACYVLAPVTQFGPGDYWTTTTIKANIENHKIKGVGSKYTGRNTAMTRIVCTSNSDTIMRMGPDAQPAMINDFPQGIEVSDIYLARSVAPLISSNARGLHMQWILYGKAQNTKTNSNMVGIEANGVVHSHQINCEAVRDCAGSGAGTDYFVGNYANGGGTIGAAGGNASLFIVDCVAGCNYGPLQTATGSIGFKADLGFTDVWYWNPETTNFYCAQVVQSNGSAALTFTNTDFNIFHAIHDQFKQVGIYVTEIASSGSVAITEPYFGPSTSARAAYWVNACEGAVTLRGGQFVMGAAPAVQPILLLSSRGCDVLDYPVILEAGNTYAISGGSDVNDARIEVFAKNPTVTAGPIIQLLGTNTNVQCSPKSSGKASAFQYGAQIIGTTTTRCTFDVSGLNSLNFPAVDRQISNNGTPIVAAGVFGTNLGQGNFN